MEDSEAESLPQKALETKPAKPKVKAFQYFQDFLSLGARVYNFNGVDGAYYHLAIDYQKILTSNSLQTLITKQAKQLESLKIPEQTDEKIAFLVNAYNFFYIQETLSEYPVKDSKEIRKSKEIYNISGLNYSLKHLEQMLVDDFEDPRLRFAMACPALSCPSLNPEIYKAENIYIQLNNSVRNYFKNPKNIKVAKKVLGDDYISTSKLFDFYEDEFESVLSFIHSYAPSRYRRFNREKQKLGFDWSLNSPENLSKSM